MSQSKGSECTRYDAFLDNQPHVTDVHVHNVLAQKVCAERSNKMFACPWETKAVCDASYYPSNIV